MDPEPPGNSPPTPASGMAPTDVAAAVRDAVLAVPGVVGLAAGVLGDVAAHLPGPSVAGIRFAEPGVHVHVILATGVVIPEVAARVHRAARAASGEDAHVHVDDLRSVDAPSGADPDA